MRRRRDRLDAGAGDAVVPQVEAREAREVRARGERGDVGVGEAAGDGQRLIRAWAVVRSTGRPLAQWQDGKAAPAVPGRRLAIQLAPPRDALYARIEARLDAMLAAGALDEVAALGSLNLVPDLPALKALGVPDFRRHLAGGFALTEALAQAKQGTRNFAKRQLTWFRHQMVPDRVFEVFGEDAVTVGVAAVREFLTTPTGEAC